MSAIFGTFERRGRPADPAIVAGMAAAIPWYGPDGGGQWAQGPVALGHLLACVTPEARGENQPLLHAGGRFALVANARLDNRRELLDQLHLARDIPTNLTDPGLILAAYAAWGEACASRLIGDFAFVIWDAAEQRLLCVRDQLGVVPFYYHLSEERFVFAGDIRALLAHPSVPDALDDRAVAMHLRFGQHVMPEMTFLAGVKKLRPAHLLTVTPDAVSVRAYWSPASVPAVRLPDADTYAERMRELLARAVSDRLRSLHPVGAHVSGGLDSSAIAAVAAKQLAARGRPLAGFSWLPAPATAAAADAPEYVATRRVAAALGLEVEPVELTVDSLCAELQRDISLDGYANLWYEPLVRAQARPRGIRVLLSGWGGDEAVSSGANGLLAELFWRGQWQTLSKVAAARSRRAARPWRNLLGQLYGQIWIPSLPALVQGRWPGQKAPPLDAYSCMAPELAARVGPIHHGMTSMTCIGLHATQVRRLTSGHLPARMEVWATQGARDGIEYRYPLLDLRLVEFALGVPAALYGDEQHTRPLFRRAVAGLVPDEIRLATLKVERYRVERYLELLEAACGRLLGEMVSDSPGAAAEDVAGSYLDLACLRQRRTTALAPAPAPHYGHLLGQERQVQVLVMARSRRRTHVDHGDGDRYPSSLPYHTLSSSASL